MKVLACLLAVLAFANAGVLLNSGLYSSGLYSSGSYISSPVTYVQSAPALQTVHVVRQPVYQTVSRIYSAPSPIYHSSSLIQTAPIYQSAPIVSVPIVSQSYGLSYGPRYASSYSIGAPSNIISVVKGDF